MIWLLFIPALFLVLCFVFSFAISRRQTQKVLLDPKGLGLSFEDILLHTSDGIQLNGLWIPAEGSTRTIIFLHGYAGTFDPDLKYVLAFHAKNFNVLLFNFRAHGHSGGRYTTLGALETRDCQAAVQAALQRGSKTLGLLGFSMGGRVAILSAPLCPEIKAVISDGGPARIQTAAAAELKQKGLPRWLGAVIAFMMELGMCFRSGINLFRQEPLFRAGKLSPLPVLFIHGDRDENTTIAELEKMVSDAGPNAACWRVAEAGHRNIDEVYPEEYIHRVLSFFEQWLPEL
jgi:uncharacterized protein